MTRWCNPWLQKVTRGDGGMRCHHCISIVAGMFFIENIENPFLLNFENIPGSVEYKAHIIIIILYM